MSEKTEFSEWAIVEIFGHQTYAGRVSEQTIGGSSFVRLDVPEVGELKPFTKLFGQGAIYCVTVVSEETARLKVAALQKQPMDRWDVSNLVQRAVDQKMLAATNVSDADEHDGTPC